MLRPALFSLALLLSLLLIPSRVSGQEAHRPKIGYVLSGGGAKGMAHVGVLKVLEEVGLQPDVITGTSMGSIMGGLYSIGYTSEDLDQLIRETDWSTILTNEIPSDKVMMRRKHEYGRFLVEMPIYNRKPELPAGLIEGQKLSELFSELTWRQAGVEDFTEFPYPFTCIGADILYGEKVLLNSGDLSSAMRSSMAIPSVFTAVERDGRILVDGGVVRNFPVQEALDLGADIIIGVYVGFDSQMSPEQLRSLTSVITMASLMSGAHDVQLQVPLVDYMIVPDLEGYTPASFTEGVEIMNRGEQAARAQIDRLRALADSINALAPPPPVKQLPDNDSILVSEITMLSGSEALKRFVVEKSGIEEGAYLFPGELNEGIDQLFGTLFFDKIEYYFEDMEEGKRLVFNIKEKPKSSLRAALHYDNTFGPGVILNYTRLNTLVEGSRLGLTGDISGAPQVYGYYDVHIGKKRNFIGTAFFRGEREKLPFYSNNVDIGNYNHTSLSGGLGLRQALGTNSSIGADLSYRHATQTLSKNIKEVMPELELLDRFVFKGPQWGVIFQYNTFDHQLYPTQGSRLDLRYSRAESTKEIWHFNFPDSLNIEEDNITTEWDSYWHLVFGAEKYFALGNRFSINPGVDMGLSKDDKPIFDNFYVGGYRYNLRGNQVAFVGLNSHELLQGNYVGGKLALQWEVIPGTFLTALANMMFVSDELAALPEYVLDFNQEALYIGAGLGINIKTPLGPVSIMYGSRTDVWNPIWYTNIGFTF